MVLPSRGTSTIVAMLGAVGAVAVLAYWDAQREAAAALEDFAQEQATLAGSLAAELDTRLSEARRDALVVADAMSHDNPIPATVAERYGAIAVQAAEATRPTGQDEALRVSVPLASGDRVQFITSVRELLSRAAGIERPNALLLLLRPPGSAAFRATSGRSLHSVTLNDALALGRQSVRLLPAAAAELGLPARTALAGLSQIEAGPLGRWSVVAVASARRERDRERRAQARLVLAVLLASGIVLVFGGATLRIQRKELALQHQLEIAQLQRQRDERLERANKAAIMGTLAMGIAHEVSTPLSVIAGRAEQVLSRVTGDDRAASGLRTILEQTDRISQVIRAFLGLARGAGPSATSLEPLAIVKGAVTLVEHRFAEAGVSLGVDVPRELPCVHGDLHLLQHALVNLLLNACDACPIGAEVKILVRATSSEIAFVVDDSGDGISPEHAALATEPFFTTKGHGAGLGLAIATEIAKSHGGKLSLSPRTPQGTRAIIELPLARGAAHEAA